MSEIEPWTRQILSVTVSQICKTIGWHSVSSTCLHVLVDIFHRYLRRMSSTVHDYAEHDNRTSPALEELFLAFNEMNVNVEELKEYVDYVAPIILRQKIPKYPLEKKSNLNFLKPGSREVVTRPVHIHEHLPAMYPELSDENYPSQETLIGDDLSLPNLANGYINGASSSYQKLRTSKTFDTKHGIEEVGRPLRELSCVMMTSSGFLSHIREARGPEARLPKSLPSVAVPIVPTPDVKPATPIENKSNGGEHKKHHKSHSSHSKSHDRHKQRDENDHHDDSKVKKLVGMKELSKLKALKPLATTNKTEDGPPSPKLASKHENRLKTPSVPNPVSPKLPKTNKHADKSDKSPYTAPYVIPSTDDNYTVAEEKLTTEPNKQKLNIFKRISKVKEDRAESPQPNKININDRNAQINDCIEAVVKRSREKDCRQPSPMRPMEPLYIEPVESEPIALSSFAENVSVTSGGSTGSSVPKHTKRKKKQKFHDPSEPPSKKTKSSGDTPPEKPKLIEPEPPPFPFFAPGVISPSLSSNLLIPRFPATFMNASMRHPNPNAPHPEMPNMPLPPPTMQATTPSKPSSSTEQRLHLHHPVTLKLAGNAVKESVDMIGLEVQHTSSMSDVAAAAAAVMDKKLKKKMKKDKREKDKKKREKKDRLKMKALKIKEKAEKKLKTKTKNKIKKKEKLAAVPSEAIHISTDDRSAVPKLTLKLNSPQPSPNGMASPKITIKPIVKVDETVPTHPDWYYEPETLEERAPSPELAKIPFIGKPSKHKQHSSAKTSSESKSSVEKSSKKSEGKSKSKEKSKSKKVDDRGKQRPPAFYYDNLGNKVWLCPGCNGHDDGSPMIGCDGCDAWYHWTCVGIKSDPESAKWFCPICTSG